MPRFRSAHRDAGRDRRRSSAGPVVSLVVLALVATGCAGSPADRSELSVILVTLDTTRADRIGAYGGEAVPTPHLDAVAREGVKFDPVLSQVPLTLPAHSTILTGRYPAAHGVRHNGIFRLQESEETLAERLGAAGFETAAFIGAFVLNSGFGTEQGFETYDDVPTDRYYGGRDQLYEAQRPAEAVNAAVFDWLDRRRDGRFFLWVHYYDPHLPYEPPESPRRELSGTGYDREISYMDSCFGDLMRRLRGDDLLDRAILVVVGDHGESLGDHGEGSHGVFLYEAALRVPLMIRAPGLLPAGATVAGPTQILDIAPTVLDLLDMGPLPEAHGVSLVPRIRGESKGDDELAYAESFMPRLEFGWSELRMVRSERYKYVEAPAPELFDVLEDPRELRNLIRGEPELGAEMARLVRDWVARTTDAEAQAKAQRTLSPEEEEKLRSLGYLAGGASGGGLDDGRVRRDPKDCIGEAVLLYEARERFVAGHAEEALAAVEKILEGNPQNHLAHSTRIQSLIRLRRLDEAEEAAIEAMAEATTDPDASATLLEKARRVLASVYWMVGKNEEAEEEYRLAIEMNRANRRAPVFPGLLLGAAGGMQEALRIIDDVLERNPRDGMALAARFELEHSRGDREAALATAELLAEVRAGDVETLVKAGRLLRDAERPDEAAVLFELAHEKKKLDPDLLGFLGTARLAAGKIREAEEALLEAKRLRPEDPRAPFYLGNIALLRNDETKARALFDEALELDPKFTPPLVNLALWLGEKDRAAEAAEVLQEAVRRNPDNTRAQELLRQLRTSGGISAGAVR